MQRIKKWTISQTFLKDFSDFVVQIMIQKSNNALNSLRASDRFTQLIFLRIFSCIGTFGRGNGCDICWSAATGMGHLWKRA